MKIVIAPDSYKECLSAVQVAAAIEQGFREIFPDAVFVAVPVADGGEGTVDAMVAATKGRHETVTVKGPLGAPVEAGYGLTGDGSTAVIEMAAASGLGLVPLAKRNPLYTTSYGTGQLIRAALDAGARKFILGIGGSATNEGGAGMLQALGVRLLKADGREIEPTGQGLGELAAIDMSDFDSRLQDAVIDVACDVDNPLCGPRGASAIFGPQKGATPDLVERLDGYLRNFAAITLRDLGVNMADMPGAGAAGGMAPPYTPFWAGVCAPAAKSSPRPWGLTLRSATRIWSSPAKGASTGRRPLAKRLWAWPALPNVITSPLLPSAVHCEATWALFSRTASTPLPACCTALAALMKHWPKAEKTCAWPRVMSPLWSL